MIPECVLDYTLGWPILTARLSTSLTGDTTVILGSVGRALT